MPTAGGQVAAPGDQLGADQPRQMHPVEPTNAKQMERDERTHRNTEEVPCSNEPEHPPLPRDRDLHDAAWSTASFREDSLLEPRLESTDAPAVPGSTLSGSIHQCPSATVSPHA